MNYFCFQMMPYFHRIQPKEITGSDLDELLALGWYRMDQTIFTSSHVGLEEVYRVHWLRYSIADIQTHESHKRISNRNKNRHHTIEDFTSIRTDHSDLYQQYRATIDFDG